MDVIVIGGGFSGLATAYQLHAAGHQVSVIERHPSVAQEATYGQGGPILPTPLDVWFGPSFMAQRRDEDNGLIYKPGMNRALRRFVRRLSTLQRTNAFTEQYTRLHPLIELARLTLGDIEALHEFEFEQKPGILHLVRTPAQWVRILPALELMRDLGIAYESLSPDACVAQEHSVPREPDFAGGILLDTERTGNCPLLAKQLKQHLEAGGVQFRFGQAVTRLHVNATSASVELAPAQGATRSRHAERLTAAAVVIAAGVGSKALLRSVGVRAPMHAARVHTLTAPIAYPEHAPHLCVVDSLKRVTMTRTSERLRISGAAVLQSSADLDKPLAEPLADAALAILGQATHDWLPGSARISASRPWQGLRLLSPDGLPLVGNAGHARVFVNAGHGQAGWGLACGGAAVIADRINGATPRVPDDTLAALDVARFPH
jgi:D-amino-acid dehydrogenase